MKPKVNFAKAEITTVLYEGKEIEVMNLPAVAAVMVHYALNPDETSDNGNKVTRVLKEALADMPDFDQTFLLAMVGDRDSIDALVEATCASLYRKFEEARLLGNLKQLD